MTIDANPDHYLSEEMISATQRILPSLLEWLCDECPSPIVAAAVLFEASRAVYETHGQAYVPAGEGGELVKPDFWSFMVDYATHMRARTTA